MKNYTLAERAEFYNSAFPDWKDSHLIASDRWLRGMWIMGQNYTVKTGLYGGYPHGYLKRIKAMFPDHDNVLHLFSGRVDTVVFPGKTVDSNPDCHPDYLDDAHTMVKVPLKDFDLVLADPPYSIEDAEHYQTTMVKRNVVMRTLGTRLRKGSFVVWLDQVLPMFKKINLEMCGTIGMVKSTNHRFRVATIFRKL